MKSKSFQFLVFITFFYSLNAQQVTLRLLDEQEILQVKQKLEAFDLGDITYESLTGNSDSNLMLTEYYFSLPPTNSVTTKMKLPLSHSLAVWGQYPQAVQLAQDYVNVYSNDSRGWGILGGSKMMLKSYDDAIAAYTNAARLGDDKNDLALGLAALAVDRMDVLEKIVIPRLLEQMNEADEFPEKKRNQMRGCIIAYAIKLGKKEVFIQAVTGVDFSKLYQWPDLENVITLACKKFKGPDIDQIRKKLAEADANVLNGGNTNSSSH
jgi:tetratricopeptide (TPR) repeat protein